jgi:hypothetical protein
VAAAATRATLSSLPSSPSQLTSHAALALLSSTRSHARALLSSTRSHERSHAAPALSPLAATGDTHRHRPSPSPTRLDFCSSPRGGCVAPPYLRRGQAALHRITSRRRTSSSSSSCLPCPVAFRRQIWRARGHARGQGMPADGGRGHRMAPVTDDGRRYRHASLLAGAGMRH